MKQAIRQRISRRTYTKEHFTQEEIQTIHGMIEKVNQQSSLTITFKEDAAGAFSSLRKSYGMFKNVRSILVMKGKKNDSDLYEKIGYYGEQLVLELTDLGYGTCWVGGTFDKEQISDIAGDEEMVCVITVGKVPDMTFKEKLIHNAISKNRKPISERLKADGNLPQWLSDGMTAVQLAPSAVNSQKPFFVYQNKQLTASVEVKYPLDLVDLGIAKKHFEIGAEHGTFAFGNGASFIQK